MTDNRGALLEDIAQTLAAWHALEEDALHAAKWWDVHQRSYVAGKRAALTHVATYLATLQTQVRDQARAVPTPASHEEDV